MNKGKCSSSHEGELLTGAGSGSNDTGNQLREAVLPHFKDGETILERTYPRLIVMLNLNEGLTDMHDKQRVTKVPSLKTGTHLAVFCVSSHCAPSLGERARPPGCS